MKTCGLTIGFKTLLLTLVFSYGCLTAAAQTTDEQILRQLIKQESAGKATIKFNENAIFASDALPSPRLVKNVNEIDCVQTQTVSVPRQNQILQTQIKRIVIAESKEIAYEYSDFTISYNQPDGTRDGYNGSYLRVWRKTLDGWRVDAVFARQNRPEKATQK